MRKVLCFQSRSYTTCCASFFVLSRVIIHMFINTSDKTMFEHITRFECMQSHVHGQCVRRQTSMHKYTPWASLHRPKHYSQQSAAALHVYSRCYQLHQLTRRLSSLLKGKQSAISLCVVTFQIIDKNGEKNVFLLCNLQCPVLTNIKYSTFSQQFQATNKMVHVEICLPNFLDTRVNSYFNFFNFSQKLQTVAYTFIHKFSYTQYT